MRGNRKLLRTWLMAAVATLMAAGMAAAADASSGARHTGGSMRVHHGPRRSAVSEVGNMKFRTVVMGTRVDVYMLEKSGRQTQPIGSATGTATLNFADGSSRDVTLAKATGPGPEHLTGTWEGVTSLPTQASVTLSGLPGATPGATFTAAFPQPKSRMHEPAKEPKETAPQTGGR